MSTASVLKDIQTNLAPEFERLFREHHAFVTEQRTASPDEWKTRTSCPDSVLTAAPARVSSDLTRNPKAYLYRAAFNAAVSVIRSRRRNDLERIEDVEAPAASPMPGVDEDTCRQLYVRSRRLVQRPHRFLSFATSTTTISPRSRRPWYNAKHRRREPVSVSSSAQEEDSRNEDQAMTQKTPDVLNQFLKEFGNPRDRRSRIHGKTFWIVLRPRTYVFLKQWRCLVRPCSLFVSRGQRESWWRQCW